MKRGTPILIFVIAAVLAVGFVAYSILHNGVSAKATPRGDQYAALAGRRTHRGYMRIAAASEFFAEPQRGIAATIFRQHQHVRVVAGDRRGDRR